MHSNSPTVAVLLATYNPNRKFIKEQISSLAQQEDVNIILYWGDDGSDFDLFEYIESLIQEFNYKCFKSNRVGFAQNFFNLLQQTEDEDYVAFCDQHDIWLPGKLKSQIMNLAGHGEVPALTHSTPLRLVNNNVQKIPNRCRDHDLKTLLVRNCVQGCTVCMNRKAKTLLKTNLESRIYWHDWWTALVIANHGKVLVEAEPLVLYRIHANNAIGMPNTINRIKTLRRNQQSWNDQTKLFLSKNKVLKLDSEVYDELFRSLVSTSRKVRLKAWLEFSTREKYPAVSIFKGLVRFWLNNNRVFRNGI